ncbi:hypothetical protein [Streptomyces sp. NPDC085540]|uniref:hypothetical protein n=1 Tax=Streptomyces sp. NPDC085540 TaxID=3365730 RepID=UPI0037CD3B95
MIRSVTSFTPSILRISASIPAALVPRAEPVSVTFPRVHGDLDGVRGFRCRGAHHSLDLGAQRVITGKGL